MQQSRLGTRKLGNSNLEVPVHRSGCEGMSRFSGSPKEKQQMTALVKRFHLLALAALICAGSQPRSVHAQAPASDRDRLIGAWHLVSLGETGPAGKLNAVAGLKGSLIYTRDGHMSVEIMYPDSSVTNDYVLRGYEASFGTYELDPTAHTVTHHVQGSITHGLVGKTLIRAYRFSGHRLIIHSTRPDEHWQVTWEHD